MAYDTEVYCHGSAEVTAASMKVDTLWVNQGVTALELSKMSKWEFFSCKVEVLP